MRRPAWPLLLTLVAFTGAGVWFATRGAGQAAAVALAPCEVTGSQTAAECATIEVPENRRDPARAIGLHVLVLRAVPPPAAGAVPARAAESVFFLTGGPGSAASASAGYLSRELSALRDTHDFVFVDQRGTGASRPLRCEAGPEAALRPMFDAAEAARCRAALEPSADLSAYTTTDAVEDLEEVRRALGYAQITLHASSYGTRVAWAYAARYPGQTRALVLHGPVPPGFLVPLPFGRALDTAIEGLTRDCLSDVSCASRFPHLRRDIETAFTRLAAAPARVQTSATDTVEFTRGEFAEAVRYLLYSPTDARRLPHLMTQAASGDYAPIARASAAYRRGLARQINMGMYLSVTCAEDIPWITDDATREALAGTRLGDYRIRQQIAACTAWPRGSGSGPSAGPLDTPTLLLIGQYDPATPVEWGRRAAAMLPRSRLVVVPHGGHTFAGLGIDGCIARLTVDTLRRGSAGALDEGCVAGARRPPFVLD